MTLPLARRPDPGTTSLSTAPCRSSIPAAAKRTRSPPPWQLRRDGAGRSGRLARPQVQKQDQPAAQREQNGGIPAGRDTAHQSDGQSGCPRNGTKRALIGKASGSTDRSSCPDAVRYLSVTTAIWRSKVTDDDAQRDKKETARCAAFPQLAGRFRRWWQVLGSNQRRLSRRFYSPLSFARVTGR